jgi:glycosyltransferase involved in cell wall biosynthesis
MKEHLVSIIIPTHNSENFIEEALRSVFFQTYSRIEVIVVDDGSTDSTVNTVAQYNKSITLLRQSNKGPGSARNAGIRLARGKYIAFLDSDDLWLQDKLLWQMRIFNRDSEVDIVFGGIENFVSPECSELACKTDDIRGFHIGTMLISKDNFLSVGYFNEDLKVGEFIEWYARAVDMNMKVYLLDKIVMRRRRHEGNMTLKFKDDRSPYFNVLRSTMLRRSKNRN